MIHLEMLPHLLGEAETETLRELALASAATGEGWCHVNVTSTSHKRRTRPRGGRRCRPPARRRRPSPLTPITPSLAHPLTPYSPSFPSPPPQVAAFLEALERMGVHVGAVNSAEEAALTVDASDVPSFRFFRDLQHLEEAVKRREINEALWR